MKDALDCRGRGPAAAAAPSRGVYRQRRVSPRLDIAAGQSATGLHPIDKFINYLTRFEPSSNLFPIETDFFLIVWIGLAFWNHPIPIWVSFFFLKRSTGRS